MYNYVSKVTSTARHCHALNCSEDKFQLDLQLLFNHHLNASFLRLFLFLSLLSTNWVLFRAILLSTVYINIQVMLVAAVDAKFTSVMPNSLTQRRTPSQTIISSTIRVTSCSNRVVIEPSRSKREQTNKQATAQVVARQMAAHVASAVGTISSGSTQTSKNAATAK